VSDFARDFDQKTKIGGRATQQVLHEACRSMQVRSSGEVGISSAIHHLALLVPAGGEKVGASSSVGDGENQHYMIAYISLTVPIIRLYELLMACIVYVHGGY